LDTTGDRTLTDLLAERVAVHGERDFLVFEDRDGAVATLTYAAFQGLVDRCARGLHLRGVGAGDFVVIHLTNCPEFLVAWFAFARLGAFFVPSNVANTAPELAHILRVTNARFVVTGAAYLGTVDAAIEASGVDTSAAATRARGSDPSVVTPPSRVDGVLAFEDLLADDGEPPSPRVASDDLAEL